jgi:hypothetical protein
MPLNRTQRKAVELHQTCCDDAPLVCITSAAARRACRTGVIDTSSIRKMYFSLILLPGGLSARVTRWPASRDHVRTPSAAGFFRGNSTGLQ